MAQGCCFWLLLGGRMCPSWSTASHPGLTSRVPASSGSPYCKCISKGSFVLKNKTVVTVMCGNREMFCVVLIRLLCLSWVWYVGMSHLCLSGLWKAFLPHPTCKYKGGLFSLALLAVCIWSGAIFHLAKWSHASTVMLLLTIKGGEKGCQGCEL